MEGIAKMKVEDSQDARNIDKKSHRKCDEKLIRKINLNFTQNEQNYTKNEVGNALKFQRIFGCVFNRNMFQN